MSSSRPRYSRTLFRARTSRFTQFVSVVVLLCITLTTGTAPMALAAPSTSGGSAPRPPVAIVGGEANAYVGVADVLDGSNSHDKSGVIAKYEWDVDDNGTWDITSASSQSPYTFFAAATSYVNLRVTSTTGLTSTDRRKYHIRDDSVVPVAVFTAPANALVDEVVTLDAMGSYDPFGTIKTYAWDFNGDGAIDSVSGVPTVSHAWAQAGTFTVKLTVSDFSGNQNTTQARLVVEGSGDATPEPPTGLVAADRTGDNGGAIKLTWAASAEADVIGYRIYRSLSADGGFVQVAQVASAGYVDSGLSDGSVYFYKITAVDAAQQESAASAVVSATPIDDSAPAAPVGLGAADVAGDQGDAIAVTWTANSESDLAGYRLTATNLVTSVSQTIEIPAVAVSYTVSGLTVSQAYRFTLVAYDQAGNVSSSSLPVQATPADQLAPEAPTGLVAFDREGDEGQAVVVRWAPNSEMDLSGYTLYRALVPAGVDPLDACALAIPVASFGSSVTEWIDETVLPGSEYCYFLVAADLSGNVSTASALAVVQPLDNVAPAAPMGVAATDVAPDQGGVVRVTWLGSMSVDVAGYRVTVLTPAGVVVSATDVGMASEFVASGLEVGVDHTFSVTAFDGAGNVSEAASAVAAGLDELAPAVPVGLGAVDVVPDQGGSIAVSWDPDTESDFDSYTLRMFDDQGALLQTFDNGFASAKVLDALAVGGTYSFDVAARDTHGNSSAFSEKVTATANDEMAPEAVTLSAVDCPDDQGGVIDLAWDAAPDGDVAGYKVYRNSAEIAQAPGTSFSDADAGSLTWTYCVAGYDGSGNVAVMSNLVEITAVDNLAPATPAAVAAADVPGDEGGVIEVSFAPVPDEDVDGYRVFCYDTMGTLVSTVEAAALDTVVRFDGLTDGLPYSFSVLAFDTSQNLSPLSAPVYGTSADNLAPDAPANLTVIDPVDNGGVLEISWTAPAQADVVGYKLYRSGVFLADVTTGTYYKDEAADGTAYSVRAYDEVPNLGLAAVADPVSADDEIAPDAPSDLTVTDPIDEGGVLEISWSAPAQADVAGYKLYRDGEFLTDVDSTFYKDEAANGTAYSVRAFDSVGNLGEAAVAAAVSADDEIAPDAPGDLSVVDPVDEGGVLEISWSAPAQTDVVGYKLYRGDIEIADQTITSYTDEAATGEAYSVVAYDEVPNLGEAIVADPVSAGDEVAPHAPSGLTAVPNDGLALIALNWSANEESDVDGYLLYRDGVRIADIPGPAYIDTGLKAGSVYVYSVTAYDTSGNESGASDPVIVKLAPPLQVPTGLTATDPWDAGGAIELQWDESTDRRVTDYMVYRSTNSGSGYELVGGTNEWSFMDIGLTDGLPYYYLVFAADEEGNVSVASTEVSAVPEDNSVATMVRSENLSPDVLYTAGWWVSTRSDSLNQYYDGHVSGDSIHFTTSSLTGGVPGASSVTFEFRGSYVTWLGIRAWNRGIAAVYIDGVFMRNVDCYKPGSSWPADVEFQAPVYTSPLLQYGDHTIKVVYTGTKNPAAAGDVIDVDGFDVRAIPDVEAPVVPIGFGVSVQRVAQGGSLRAAWTLGSEADLGGYQLYRSASVDGPYRVIAELGKVNTYVDDSVENGTTYYYKLTAVDNVGNLSARTAAAQCAPMAAPGGVTVADHPSDQGLALDISWIDSPEPNVVGYKVYRSDTESGTYSLATTLGDLTAWTDQSVSKVGTRYYKVSAIDGAGNESALSGAAGAVAVDNLAPAVPMGLSGAVERLVTGGKTRVSWSTSTESDLAGYLLYRAVAVDGPYGQLAALGKVATYLDANLDNGMVYYYRLASVDQAGNVSEMTAWVSATPAAHPATSVTARNAQRAPGHVGLVWTPSDAIDLAGYHIYRAGPAGEFTLLSTVGKVSVFTDVSAPMGEALSYRVVARDVNGAESPSYDTVDLTVQDGPLFDVRIENTNPLIAYTAGWWASTLSGSLNQYYDGYTSGDSVHLTTSTLTGGVAGVSSATLTFSGSYVTWLGIRAWNRGIAAVYVDGKFMRNVDCYKAGTSWPADVEFQAPLYTSSLLPYGEHTIKIVYTGTKNTAATDYVIDVDAFDVRE